MMPVKTYYLKQQTPMIHFQSKEVGATLRASEVKPKLDRFLIAQLGGEAEVSREWWIESDNRGNPVHPALNYKMRFKAKGNASANHHVYNKRDGKPYRGYGCYFFTGNNPESIKSSSFHTEIQLDIICFHEKLAEEIDKCLCKFFALNNFGFRQNKGFGSFIIKNTEEVSRNFAKVSGYYLEITSTKTTDILDEIKNFYQELKNGINIPQGRSQGYERSFLMKEYFSGHLNDKKAMKLAMLNTGLFNLASQNIRKYDDDTKSKASKIKLSSAQINNAEYIRGLLGFADFYTFRDVELINIPNVRFNVTFDVDGRDIQRFQSPITFKPIMERDTTYIYILFDKDRLSSILGKTVELKCKNVTGTDLDKETIRRPENEITPILAEVNSAIEEVETVSLRVPDEFYKTDTPDNFLNSLLSEAFKSGRFDNLKEVK